MGFERLTRVLQGKQSNYDTDIFSGTIDAIARITKRQYDGSDSREAIAFRVLSDHIRAISFTIADGQLPSNTGAGYVIRRILRRAVRYYYSYLNYRAPLLCQLVAIIADQFKNVFPELKAQQDFVAKAIKEEEEGFLRTLEKGLKRIDDIMANAKDKQIPGEQAFELYDTYGFPYDLTQLIALENGLRVDEKGFQEEMAMQKERSRVATKVDTGDWVVLAEGQNRFVGYDTLETSSRVLRYRKVKAKGTESWQLVLENTPFYAESGGQVGDRGELLLKGDLVKITDTKRENDLIIHYAQSIPASLEGELVARVNPGLRKSTALHHSATHLLHAALRKVLGNHVAQKGSLVNEERLRFDFSHFAKMTDEEIEKVEDLVNEKIRENIPVVIKELPKEEAMQMGAMALFGEKYGDRVRVVIMDPGYSVELCGGTHVGSTGELGLFILTAEAAIAAGVRRVEAVCGMQAQHLVREQAQQLRTIKESLRNPADPVKAIEALHSSLSELKKHADSMEARHLVSVRNALMEKDEIINGVNFIGNIVEVSNADALKKICLDLKNNLRDHVAVLCLNLGGKPYVALGISETVCKARNLDAGKIIKEKIAPLIKGGGGGQKTLATGAGQDAGSLKEVINVVKEILEKT
jgi:alanyl-tRNA synthetase